MSGFAILVAGKAEQPRPVRLFANAGELELCSADGSTETVRWWWLYRSNNDPATHRFRRLDRKDWELRVTAGGDRDLLAHVGRRPLHRILHPFRRFESLKVLLGIAVLSVTVAGHLPPEWLARSVPDWAQARLVNSIVAQNAPIRCSRAGGAEALRKILVRLEPDLGKQVDVVAINGGAFTVTSTPGHKIYMYRSSMTEIDSAALPALLAHELSHIRHNDPIAATIRHNGFLGTWAAIMEGSGRRSVMMDFSGLEERRADLEAMQMMRRAGIPLRPAAQMFEAMRVSKAQGGYFGYDQRDFHFGVDARTQRWAVAARADPPNPKPLLTGRESDDLYNFCWSGPIEALPGPPRQPSAPPPPPGTGAIALPDTPKH